MGRSPNSEQKIAIEHEGGVLLEAGAGSGKTFVLVEHIFYLLEKFYQKLQSTSDNLEIEISKKMSTIIMMTFTTKAAGEMALRLQERCQEYIQKVDAEKGKLFLRCLDALNILTIDGFCAKLVKEGFFSGISNRFEIVDEIRYFEKISGLINAWRENAESIYAQDTNTWDILTIKYDTLVENFVAIFSSAEMRLLWNKTSIEDMVELDIAAFIETIVRLENIDLHLAPCPFGEKYFKQKANDEAAIYFSQLDKLAQNTNFSSATGCFVLFDFFITNPKSFGRSGPRSPEAMVWKQQISHLRKFSLEVGHLLKNFQEHKQKLINWITILKDIFDYIDTHYLDDTYFCFADLGYYVYCGLEDREVVDNIHNNYNYFIVDEFQDTSQIQFDTLRRLLQEDLSRLFAVGDKKQAIYAFRGGEIAVFNQCAEIMQQQGLQNLCLTNNYRSLGNIIEFNNELFAHIFKMGKEFNHIDQFAVDVVKQTIPLAEKIDQGEIFPLEVIVQHDTKFKLSNYELNLIEAECLLEHIHFLLAKYPQDQICILYKKLTPLAVMFPLLLQSPLHFTSQVKIAKNEDPVILIFSFAVSALWESEAAEDNGETLIILYARLIQGVIYYLNLHFTVEELVSLLHELASHYELFGMQSMLDRLFYRLGISNSNYIANINSIMAVITEARGQLGAVYDLIKNHFNDERYSIEFQKGSGGRVVIMTAHASKGLEFDHVLIGGVSTNGTDKGNSDYFGKFPGSMKWQFDTASRKLIDTPQFYLEKLIASFKNFAESKRLFYVVGTRAIKSISWVGISTQWGDKTKSRVGVKNSWIYGIDQFISAIDCSAEQEFSLLQNVVAQGRHYKKITYPLEQSLEERSLLFHIDHLGIEHCPRQHSNENLIILSELSVTALASLSTCPKRFYLKNILKLDSESFSFLDCDNLEDVEKEIKEGGTYREDIAPLINYAARGTAIHQAIYDCLTNNISQVNPDEWSLQDAKSINWALSVVGKKAEHIQKIAEQSVKFDFFSLKISGIPDLVLLDRDKKVLEVWDYKTGYRNTEKESTYCRQLQYYVYGLATTLEIPTSFQLKGVLLYVDQQEMVEFEFLLSDLKEVLFTAFSQMNDLLEENTSNCQFCKFKQLCRP